MDLIRAEKVCFTYSGSPVLHEVSFSVGKGRSVSLLGPNGSGKSTLLKVLLGIYRPRSGSVFFEGKPIELTGARELAKRIAYVPQTHKMSFAYTVLDVVLMGRTPHRSFLSRCTKQDYEVARHCLDRLSISHLSDRSYTELSGGERQLALIARALTQGAKTLVMDEPANGLDFGNQIRLLDRIADLAREGYTFVMSTHFPDHALWIADQVIMLHRGRVVADGSPGEVMDEETVCRLYDTQVSIFKVTGGVRTCLPRSVLNNGAAKISAPGIDAAGSRERCSPQATGGNGRVREA